MTKDLKEKIDDIWLKSDYGKWCIAVSNNDKKKADAIKEKLFESGYLYLSMVEDELANKIAEILHDEAEVDEYLQLWEDENSDLVDVMIRQDLFYQVQKLLRK